MNSGNKPASHLFFCLFLVAGILMSIAKIRGETDHAKQIKYPSPNGRFVLRITQAKDNEYQPTVELIEKDSGKVMLTLDGDSDREAFDASDSVLVWSPDSKRAAYGFRATPPGARIEERSAVVCFWNGSGFDKVLLPDNLPTPSIKLPKGKEGSLKPYGGGVTPVKWLKSGDLEMSSEEMMLSRDSGKSYTGVLHFTISFDAQHHPSVNKIGKTKTEISE
jgi:hypothetical protein